MPPLTEWPVADGPVAPLVAPATIDAHTYYSVFRTWKEEGKRLGRIFLISVVFFLNETTDHFEAAFQQRTNPHPEEARQRSHRMKFALQCVRKLMGDNIPPPILNATLLPLFY